MEKIVYEGDGVKVNGIVIVCANQILVVCYSGLHQRGKGFIPSALNVLFAVLDQSGESGQLIAAY